MKLAYKTFITVAIFTFMACGSDSISDNTNAVSNSSQKVTATINGEKFESDFASAQKVVDGKTILISATRGMDEELSLFIPASAKSGDSFSIESGEFITGYDVGSSQGNMGKTGNVSIITHDVNKNHITGEFSFTTGATGPNEVSYEFKQGEFGVSYP